MKALYSENLELNRRVIQRGNSFFKQLRSTGQGTKTSDPWDDTGLPSTNLKSFASWLNPKATAK